MKPIYKNIEIVSEDDFEIATLKEYLDEELSGIALDSDSEVVKFEIVLTKDFVDVTFKGKMSLDLDERVKYIPKIEMSLQFPDFECTFKESDEDIIFNYIDGTNY